MIIKTVCRSRQDRAKNVMSVVRLNVFFNDHFKIIIFKHILWTPT